MSEFKLVDHNTGNTRTFDSRATAEEKKEDMRALGASEDDLEIKPVDKGTCGGTEVVEDTADHLAPCDICGETVDVTSPSAASGAGRKPVHKSCVTDSADNNDAGAEVVEEAVGSTPPPTDENEPTPEPVESDLPDDTSSADDPLAQLGEELGTDPLDILPSHMIDKIQGEPAVNKRGYAMIAERYGIEAKAEVVEMPWENDEGRCVAKATATTEDGKEYSGWASACASDGDMSEQLIELAETRSLKRCVSWASGVGIVSYQELSGELE